MINQALEQVKKAKHYYLTVILSLTLTLTAVLSVFSIVDTVYLKPLPYGKADNIYQIGGMVNPEGKIDSSTNLPGLFHIKKHSSLIAEMAIYMQFNDQKISSLSGRPAVPVFFASPDFFSLIQTKPLLGRFFNAKEKLGNKQPSAILSYQAWQKYFSGNPYVVGSKVQLDQRSYTIIGVTPDNWVLPNFTSTNAAIWLPLDMSNFDVQRYTGFGDNVGALARFKENVSLDQVSQEISPIYYKGVELMMPNVVKILLPFAIINHLPDAIRGDSVVLVLMLIGGATLLIIIALVNLGNLQMARAVGRIKPLAISYAFGATRKQIFKELFTHNFCITAFAVLLSLALTHLSFVSIENIANRELPRMESLGVSFYMLVFALVLTLAIAALFSWIELQTADENNLQASLQSSGKGTGKQMRKGISHLLIGLQLCFAILTLVATSQVLFTTLSEALRPNNITTDNLWSIKLNFAGIGSKKERVNINQSVISHFKSKDFIKKISYSSEMKVGEISRGFVYNENNEQIATSSQILVDSEQFELYGMMIKGRTFKKDDFELEFHPVIINQRLAQYFSGNAIGQKIIIDDKKPHEIIGVASNTDFPGASSREDPEVYLPSNYQGWRSSILTVQTEPSYQFNQVETLLELLQIDPRLDLTTLTPVSEQFLELSKSQRFGAYIASALSLTSLIMVVAGIIGMVSYMVSMNRYDLGVKMAMGATKNTLLKSQFLVLCWPLAISVLFASSVVIFALGYTRTIPSWGFLIQWDIIAYTLVLLIFLTMAACFFPISKVLKADPIKALRN
jgi:putative ABC transport system permease protein